MEGTPQIRSDSIPNLPIAQIPIHDRIYIRKNKRRRNRLSNFPDNQAGSAAAPICLRFSWERLIKIWVFARFETAPPAVSVRVLISPRVSYNLGEWELPFQGSQSLGMTLDWRFREEHDHAQSNSKSLGNRSRIGGCFHFHSRFGELNGCFYDGCR